MLELFVGFVKLLGNVWDGVDDLLHEGVDDEVDLGEVGVVFEEGGGCLESALERGDEDCVPVKVVAYFKSSFFDLFESLLH